MILTEEQRAALKRVVAYMDEMYAIASPYHGCTEDANILRAMIDSSEHFTDASKMIGFDLEKGRAEVATASARRFSESREQARIFCAEEILPDALDEIERLREENAGLSKAVISIQEERDLAQAEFRAYHKAWEEQAAEIERLRAKVGKMEFLMRSTEDTCLACAIKLEVVDQQAARIKELEDAHKRSGAKYAKIINELRSSVYANIPGLKKQWDEILNTSANGKIGPDAKPRSPQESDDLKHCHSCGKSIEEVKGNLCKGDYFIGSIFLDPGQEASRFDPPIEASYYFSCCDCARSWQITDERKAALWHAINVLKENDIMEEPEEHLWDEEVTVLQAMLTEAE